MTAALFGGNCRVGLEDHFSMSKGTLSQNNSELVEKIGRIISEYSIESATPYEARKILAIVRT